MEADPAPAATAPAAAPAAAATSPERSGSAEAAGSSSSPGAGAAGGEVITVRAVYAGATHEIAVGLDEPVAQLVSKIATKTKCTAATMKIMLKGLLCAPNRPDLLLRTLRQAGVANNAKLLVVGSTASQLMEAISAQTAAKTGTFSAAADEEEGEEAMQDWNDMTVHKRVLSKGKPADAQFAYRPGQDPCPPSIFGMMDGHGKVRFSIKLDEGQLVISTNENTKKVPLSSIRDVVHRPIRGHEEYLIVGLVLGTTAQSTYYVYWFPAQNINSFKSFIGM
eukprot:m.190909 g.190909  ORF g.190909 m.190909 type:complete len:279 (+) comp17565_c1_seq27:138-974(+)